MTFSFSLPWYTWLYVSNITFSKTYDWYESDDDPINTLIVLSKTWIFTSLKLHSRSYYPVDANRIFLLSFLSICTYPTSSQGFFYAISTIDKSLGTEPCISKPSNHEKPMVYLSSIASQIFPWLHLPWIDHYTWSLLSKSWTSWAFPITPALWISAARSSEA